MPARLVEAGRLLTFPLTLGSRGGNIDSAMGKTNKKNRGKDAYTVTEVGTLVDEFRKEFRVFGERQEGIIKKLDATYEQTGRNTEQITLLEIAVKEITSKIAALAEKVDKNTSAIAALAEKVDKNAAAIAELAEKVDKNTKAIEALTRSIDKLVQTKADREEILTLEKRVSALETKVSALLR